jgi:hypothetical protein
MNDLKEKIKHCARIKLKDAQYRNWGWGTISNMRDGFILLWFPDVKSHLSFLKRA